ncbi:MAG: aminotransferase class I/II-fold pyridoxal phosphate-dependent enzyme [Chloroflexi bacterium]|nr:aminotransferase class I/II-fold pyridoxal phosphate-dependent enzyme [Chloroflexota bacterium]
MQPADRIATFKPYYFAQVGRQIRQMRAQGRPVVRMDIGAPDLPPPDFVIEAMIAAARRPDRHSYQPYGGTPAYKAAWAEYYARRFGVDLDPETQVVGLIGSKEGIFHLTQAVVNPGDVVLVPDPGYPVYSAAARIAGAQVVTMPLRAEGGFFPDLSAIPEDLARRAKLLWLNYPNNPTGATVTLDQLAAAVDFARHYRILLAHDAPYVDVVLDESVPRPPSVLQVPGAVEVAVEFNSLSKRANMAGWRLGAAVGHAQALKYLFLYKSQVDSSTFGPLMDAAPVALNDPRMEPWLRERNGIYRQRRDLILAALPELGLHAAPPAAGLYVWARLPRGLDSLTFCQNLLQEYGVSWAPGRVFGEHGEGYVRISLGTATDQVRAALTRLLEGRKAHAA